MERIEKPQSDSRSARFSFSVQKESGNQVLNVQDAYIGYDGQTLAGPINLNIRKQEAIAIVGPIIMPFKIVIPPASYTLGSHVAIFIAMFLSPWMTVFVVLGSTIGFFLAGFPFIIVLRAFSHILFGTLGALYLRKFPNILENKKSSWIFNIVLAIIHAIGEVFVCFVFYSVTGQDLQKLLYVLIVLVGVGTIIHSMVDYVIAIGIYRSLKKIHKREG